MKKHFLAATLSVVLSIISFSSLAAAKQKTLLVNLTNSTGTSITVRNAGDVISPITPYEIAPHSTVSVVIDSNAISHANWLFQVYDRKHVDLGSIAILGSHEDGKYIIFDDCNKTHDSYVDIYKKGPAQFNLTIKKI